MPCKQQACLAKHILVTEDHPTLEEQMQQAWVRLSGEATDKLDVAFTFESARAKLLSRRYRVVSTDLRLTHSEGAPRFDVHPVDSDPQAGLRLLSTAGLSRLSRRVIYTGFSGSNEGQRALDRAGASGVLYLRKGNADSSKDNPYPPIVDAYGWAACLNHLAGGNVPSIDRFKELLQTIISQEQLAPRMTPYFEAFWRDAPLLLPAPLAREAAVLHEGFDRGQVTNDQMLAAHRFRQWVLVLARAQTAALAKSLNSRWPGPVVPLGQSDDRAMIDLERRFETSDAVMNEVWTQHPSWRSHLGGEENRSGLALGAAAQALRQMRNRNVHSLKTAVAPDMADFREALLPLMDAAAYWADFPWFMNLRYEAGRWSVDAPLGHGSASKLHMDLPPDLKLGSVRSSSERVHQLQWRRTGRSGDGLDEFEPALVDAWPWLRVVSGSLVALWHPIRAASPGQTIWQAMSFAGEAQQLQVSDREFEPGT